MRKSRVALAASVLTGFSALAFAVSSGTASADSQAALPISAFGDIVVDGVHKRVFISDPVAGKVVATDYRGAVVGELTGLKFALGLALSGDSSQLYVAAANSRAIVAVPTATLSSPKLYPVGERSPRSVAPAGGKLWFSYGEGDGGGFGSVDPVDSTVHLHPSVKADGYEDTAPLVYSSPAAPGMLVVTGGEYISDATTTVYDVSSGVEVQTARGPSSAIEDTAFTADGSHLVRITNGAEWQQSVSDLATTTTYPALARANAVDVHTDGRIAISVANQATGDDVYVFEGGSTTAAQTIRLPEAGAEPDAGSGEPASDGIQKRGIAWEPGGPRLFGVAKYDRAFRLWVMNDGESPAPAAPALTLNRNGAVYAYGSTVSFTAHLGTTDTNRTVEIWADPAGPEANRLLKKGTVNSAGDLSASLKLTRNTVLTAKFAGDAKYAARTVTSAVYTKVAVRTAISKHYRTAAIGSTKYFFFHKATTPVFSTTMTAYPGRKQKLVVQYWSGGQWKTRSSTYVAVGANGLSTAKLSGSHPLQVRFRVRAAYVRGSSGDSANYTTYGAWKYFTFRR
jgi:sugar lactone lactonase YvrE